MEIFKNALITCFYLILFAANYRRLKSQPRVSIKRKEYTDEFTKLIESDLLTGANLREKLEDNICPICGKKLIDSRGLQKHMKYHKAKEERKAECPQCKRRFSTVSNLKIHMSTHLKDKSFKCPFCPVVYCHTSSLRKHLRDKHKNEKGLERELKRKFNNNSKDLRVIIKSKMGSEYEKETESDEVNASEENMEEYEMMMELEEMDDIQDNFTDEDESDASSTVHFNKDKSTNQNVAGTDAEIL